MWAFSHDCQFDSQLALYSKTKIIQVIRIYFHCHSSSDDLYSNFEAFLHCCLLLSWAAWQHWPHVTPRVIYWLLYHVVLLNNMFPLLFVEYGVWCMVHRIVSCYYVFRIINHASDLVQLAWPGATTRRKTCILAE